MPLTPAKKAVLFKVTGNRSSDPNDDDPRAQKVQFNPTTLSYTVQNRLETAGRDASARQFVAQSTAKLEFELIFDSTHDGHDVRLETSKIKEFLNPGKPGTEQPAPPIIGFRWGAFSFRGIIESYRETLDFFSSDGIPLRSGLKLVMAAQDAAEIFRQEDLSASATGVDAADVRLVTLPPGGASDLGNLAGSAGAARALGTANGLASLRMGGGAAAVATGGVTLNAAAGFSAGAGAGLGAGIGAGAGIGLGAGIGVGIGASAGVGVGVGASIGGGISAGAGIGSSSSAGISATAGAFAGLGVPKPPILPSAAQVSPFATPPAAAVSTVGLGGKLIASASAGLGGDMGAEARLRFD